jgi:hypothetical protein
MTLRKSERDLLDQLVATSPQAVQLVARHFERPKAVPKVRGRPKVPAGAYKKLALLWRSYRRPHPELTDEEAFPRFLRIHGEHIKTALGLKRNTFESNRKAVLKGDRQIQRINTHRQQTWHHRPTLSLGDLIEGRHSRPVTDPARYLIEKTLLMQALGVKL